MKFIRDTLERAKAQYEIFNIRPDNKGDAKSGVSALLDNIFRETLHMESSDFVAQDLQGRGVDVYFKARGDNGPEFYTFKSVIKKVQSGYEHSQLELLLPTHLKVEQKRHFLRVQPQKSDVQVIGVWPIKPGSRLPHSSAEIGKPITQYRKGRTGDLVQVENVSASGIALRFKLDGSGNLSEELDKASQLLCLVVFLMDENQPKPTAFWCTGEKMNSRTVVGKEKELILGLEYTNWAILEQGTSDIHWAHSSPVKGARPIQQWVEKIDHRQAASQRENGS